MDRRPLWILLVLGLAGVGCGGQRTELAVEAKGEEPEYRPLDQVAPTDRLIRQYETLVEREPDNVAGMVLLGHMYLRKARETGDAAYFGRGQTVVLRALEKKPKDRSARTLHCQILASSHQFKEALELARKLAAEDPGEGGFSLLEADALLELGKLDEAEQIYKKVKPDFILSRLARLADLRGHPDEAYRLMQEASRHEAQKAVTPEERAWYPARLGEMCLGRGKIDEAERHYRDALKTAPGYYLALAGLARTASARGETREAIRLFQQASALSPDPVLLHAFSDECRAADEAFLTRVVEERLVKTCQGQPAYNRELALFYADREKNLEAALELARKDLEARQDIYGYDTLAWVLHKNGKHDEAAAASAEALRYRTQDARLWFHAGMIHAALKHQDEAVRCLKAALEIEPNFSPLHAKTARETLASLAP